MRALNGGCRMIFRMSPLPGAALRHLSVYLEVTTHARLVSDALRATKRGKA